MIEIGANNITVNAIFIDYKKQNGIYKQTQKTLIPIELNGTKQIALVDMGTDINKISTFDYPFNKKTTFAFLNL